jgi:hypothetical protein
MNNGNHFTYQLLQLNYLTILCPRMSARLPLVTTPIIAPIVKTDLVQSYLAASSHLAFDTSPVSIEMNWYWPIGYWLLEPWSGQWSGHWTMDWRTGDMDPGEWEGNRTCRLAPPRRGWRRGRGGRCRRIPRQPSPVARREGLQDHQLT